MSQYKRGKLTNSKNRSNYYPKRSKEYATNGDTFLPKRPDTSTPGAGQDRSEENRKPGYWNKDPKNSVPRGKSKTAKGYTSWGQTKNSYLKKLLDRGLDKRAVLSLVEKEYRKLPTQPKTYLRDDHSRYYDRSGAVNGNRPKNYRERVLSSENRTQKDIYIPKNAVTTNISPMVSSLVSPSGQKRDPMRDPRIRLREQRKQKQRRLREENETLGSTSNQVEGKVKSDAITTPTSSVESRGAVVTNLQESTKKDRQGKRDLKIADKKKELNTSDALKHVRFDEGREQVKPASDTNQQTLPDAIKLPKAVDQKAAKPSSNKGESSVGGTKVAGLSNDKKALSVNAKNIPRNLFINKKTIKRHTKPHRSMPREVKPDLAAKNRTINDLSLEDDSDIDDNIDDLFYNAPDSLAQNGHKAGSDKEKDKELDGSKENVIEGAKDSTDAEKQMTTGVEWKLPDYVVSTKPELPKQKFIEIDDEESSDEASVEKKEKSPRQSKTSNTKVKKTSRQNKTSNTKAKNKKKALSKFILGDEAAEDTREKKSPSKRSRRLSSAAKKGNKEEIEDNKEDSKKKEGEEHAEDGDNVIDMTEGIEHEKFTLPEFVQLSQKAPLNGLGTASLKDNANESEAGDFSAPSKLFVSDDDEDEEITVVRPDAGGMTNEEKENFAEKLKLGKLSFNQSMLKKTDKVKGLLPASTLSSDEKTKAAPRRSLRVSQESPKSYSSEGEEITILSDTEESSQENDYSGDSSLFNEKGEKEAEEEEEDDDESQLVVPLQHSRMNSVFLDSSDDGGDDNGSLIPTKKLNKKRKRLVRKSQLVEKRMSVSRPLPATASDLDSDVELIGEVKINTTSPIKSKKRLRARKKPKTTKRRKY